MENKRAGFSLIDIIFWDEKREREEKKKKKEEDKTSANVFLNGFNYSLTSTHRDSKIFLLQSFEKKR